MIETSSKEIGKIKELVRDAECAEIQNVDLPSRSSP